MDGRRVYGNPRDSHDEADKDRLAQHQPETSKRDAPTFQKWAEDQLQGEYGAKIAASTFETNETIRTVHIHGTTLGKTKLHRLTSGICKEWVKGLKGSPAYVRRCAAFASKLGSLAVNAGHLTQNPFRGLELPIVDERENRTLSPDEAVKLLNPVTRTDAMMLVAMLTGVRRGELRLLEWAHVREDTLKIPGTKSAKSRRVVPLTPEVKAAIEGQPKRSKYIFTTESGAPLSPRNITRDFQIRKAQLGLPAETRLHDLRGSYASLLVEQGEDLRSVMELMGHADVRTTVKVYTRAREVVKKRAVSKLVENIRLAAEVNEK